MLWGHGMPLVQVNISGDRLDGENEVRASLAAALAGRRADTPVILLLHGYKFSPHCSAHDPHTHILSMEPRRCWKAVSWPRKLGLGRGEANEPLCIAVGWEARGTLWQAYRRAETAGAGLAALIALIKGIAPGVPVQALAHSLGARVVLSALGHLPAGAMDRAVLLAAAELRSRAAIALDCPAGQRLDVLNVTSGENLFFDALLTWLIAPHAWGERSLGAGLAHAERGMEPTEGMRWLDLQIDDAGHRAALAALGYPIPAPDRRICHWSVYLRTGLFDVYRAVLTGALPQCRLSAALPAPMPLRVGPPGPALPLPMLHREAS